MWKPISLVKIENILLRKIPSPRKMEHDYVLRKNIAYNLQYLEFMDVVSESDNIKVTSVIDTLNYKIFVIVSFSIIEGIMYHEIKKNNLENRTSWEKMKEITGQNKIFLGSEKYEVRVENILYKKLEVKKETEMKSISMIDKLESKKIFGDDKNLYSDIRKLLKLRNKIHIHVYDESKINTDWNNFDKSKMILAKKILWEILRRYFQITEHEKKKYFYYLV